MLLGFESQICERFVFFWGGGVLIVKFCWGEGGSNIAKWVYKGDIADPSIN